MTLWQLERGASIVDADHTRFAVWAPKAEAVAVLLWEGGGKEPRVHELQRGDGGVFEATVRGARAGMDYRFRLDGKTDLPDPVSRFQPEGVHGPSRIVDPSAYQWTDARWAGIEMADYAIYELHVGTFTHGGTFDSAIEKLDYLVDLGVTAVEVMPIAEFPGDRNWGYDGVFLFAPESAYGGPPAFRRFVDAAHGRGLAVVLDVVYNHLGPEGNYLGAYGPYFTDRYKTPWGDAVNYDGPDSDEVRRFVLDNVRYWISEYHVDGLRLDAVHGIYDFGATHILREIADAAHETGQRLKRRAVVIAESDLNDARLIRSPEQGGYGLDAQWSDDFHHAVHATLTGERSGYYEDFGGGSTMIAKALGERFVYAGEHSTHRKRKHGAPATDVSAARFVVCLQNHDQVGNRATGDRLSGALDEEERRLAAALLLLSGYVPLLFMGEEYAETNPFQYFVSHSDEQLVEAVRKGRREEFKAFGWGEEVPDPQATATFERSKLDWRRAEEPGHAELRTFYRDLLHLRRQEPALRPGGANVRVSHDPGCDWITIEYVPPRGASMVAMFNLAPVERRIPLAGSATAEWKVILTTEDVRYGTRSERRRSPLATEAPSAHERRHTPQHGEPVARVLTVPAKSAALCRRERM